MTIDILCKVVDNYGDIGVVYRLARALSELDPSLKLRLVVDDLRAFKALAGGLDEGKAVQTLRGWTVVGPEGAPELFRAERPRRIIECFACGRPDWYEDILFDPKDEEPRLIVNLEYLSAEDFATEMHLMPSATRSSFVKKAIFMPGFAQGTGGLIIDERFARLRETYDDEKRVEALRRALIRKLGAAEGSTTPVPDHAESLFWVSIFSYERNYDSVVRDLSAFHRGRPILALVAAGKSAGPFLDAWNRAGRPFPALALPFVGQETWDEVILASDFAVVRGEESLARAALSGRPFLWHAYRLDDNHQLVKVRALIERMRPFFAPDDFRKIERTFIAFNEKSDGEELAALLNGLENMKTGCRSWSESLFALGNLARGLLTFIRDFG